jgi:N-acetyl-anhydromuramyl-L-alanine amidase AmpD
MKQNKKQNAASKPLRSNYRDKTAALGLQLSAKGYKASRRNAIPRIERTVFCTAFQILLRPDRVRPE